MSSIFITKMLSYLRVIAFQHHLQSDIHLRFNLQLLRGQNIFLQNPDKIASSSILIETGTETSSYRKIASGSLIFPLSTKNFTNPVSVTPLVYLEN